MAGEIGFVWQNSVACFTQRMFAYRSRRRRLWAVRSALVRGTLNAPSGLRPRRQLRKYRISLRRAEPAVAIEFPKRLICSSSAILRRLTPASSSTASAAVRAHSNTVRLVLLPAMLRASSSTSLASIAVVTRPDRKPCRYAFPLARSFPALVEGPVLFRALRLLAAIWRSLAIRFLMPPKFFHTFQSLTHSLSTAPPTFFDGAERLIPTRLDPHEQLVDALDIA